MSRLIFSLMLLCGTMQATNTPANNAAGGNNQTGQAAGNGTDEKRPTNPTLQNIWDLINKIKTQGSNLNATLVEIAKKITQDDKSKDSSIIIKLDNVMKEFAARIKSIIDIRTQDKATRDVINEIRSMYSKIQDETRQAEGQLASSKYKYNELSQSIQEKQNTIAQLVENARWAGSKLNQLEQELIDDVAKIDDAETSAKNLQDDIDHLNTTTANLNDQIKSKTNEIQANNKRMEVMNSEIANKQKEQNKISGQLKNLRDSLSKVEAAFQKNSNELFAKQTELGVLSRNLSAAQTEEANLKTLIGRLQSSINELNTRSTPSEIIQIQGKLDQIRASIERLKMTAKEVEQRTREAREAFNKRSNDLNKLVEDYKNGVRQVDRLEAEIAEIQQGSTELAQEKLNQEKAIEKAKETLKKNEEQLRLLNIEKVKNMATKNSATQESAIREEELKKINDQITKLEREIQQLINQITRDHEALKSNNSSEINRYDDAAMRFDGAIGRINISINGLGERLKLFKQSVQEIKDRNAAAMAQRQGITNALSLRSQSQQAD